MKVAKRHLYALALLSAILTGGCATNEATLEGAYKNYGRFVAIQRATVIMTEDPFTPQEVKEAAARAVVAAKPIADTMYDAAREYAVIQGEIEAMQQAGQVVPEEKVLLALQAQNKLRGLYVLARPRILETIKIVNGFRF
jgi:hypothetical protein